MASDLYLKFSASIERFSRQIEAFERLRRVGSVTIGKGALGSSGANADGNVNEVIELPPTWANTFPHVYTGLFLLAWGMFESFVKASLKEVLNKIVDERGSVDKLPKPFRKRWEEYALKMLNNPNFGPFRPYTSQGGGSGAPVSPQVVSLAGQLHSYYRRDNALQLDCDVALVTESNMDPRLILELFRLVEVDNLWDNIRAQTYVQSYFQQTSVSKGDITSKLEDIKALRNQFAHPVEESSYLSADSVKEYLEFILVLSQAMDEQCSVLLNARR